MMFLRYSVLRLLEPNSTAELMVHSLRIVADRAWK